MTQPSHARMPAPIAAVLLLSAVIAAFFGLATLGGIGGTDYDTATAFDAGAFAVFGYIAFGSWRGWRPAQALGVLTGAALVIGGMYLALASTRDLAARLYGYDNLGLVGALIGLVLAGLLVVPARSRDWFTYER